MEEEFKEEFKEEYIEDYVEMPEKALSYDDTTKKYVNNESGVYSVILLSGDDWDRAEAKQILHQVMDYTLFSANEILSELPAEVARGLSYRQAVCLTQVLTEYGMAAAIFNGRGYVNPGRSAVSTALDGEGKMLPAVAAILATIGVEHRLAGHWKFGKGDPSAFAFHPEYSFECRSISQSAPRQLIHAKRKTAGPGGRQAQVIQPVRKKKAPVREDRPGRSRRDRK